MTQNRMMNSIRGGPRVQARVSGVGEGAGAPKSNLLDRVCLAVGEAQSGV